MFKYSLFQPAIKCLSIFPYKSNVLKKNFLDTNLCSYLLFCYQNFVPSDFSGGEHCLYVYRKKSLVGKAGQKYFWLKYKSQAPPPPPPENQMVHALQVRNFTSIVHVHVFATTLLPYICIMYILLHRH